MEKRQNGMGPVNTEMRSKTPFIQVNTQCEEKVLMRPKKIYDKAVPSLESKRLGQDYESDSGRGSLINDTDDQPSEPNSPRCGENQQTLYENITDNAKWSKPQKEAIVDDDPGFVVGRIGPEGGEFGLKDPCSQKDIRLIFPPDAVDKPTELYMSVTASEYSPKVTLRPNGTQFKRPVSLLIPVLKPHPDGLKLSRRSNGESDWQEDPDKVPYFIGEDYSVIELSSFSDYELAPPNALRVRFLVYVQKGEKSAFVRAYICLDKEKELQKISDREKGQHGRMELKCSVFICEAHVQIAAIKGCKVFGTENSQTFTKALLSEKKSYGSSFTVDIIPNSGDSQVEVCVVKKFGDPFEQRLSIKPTETISQPLNESQTTGTPPYSPLILFPRGFVEDVTTSIKVDYEDDKLLELLYKVDGRTHNPTQHDMNARGVMDYIHQVFTKRRYEKRQALNTLQQYLRDVGLYSAAEFVAGYLTNAASDPQEHSESEASNVQNWSDSLVDSKTREPLTGEHAKSLFMDNNKPDSLSDLDKPEDLESIPGSSLKGSMEFETCVSNNHADVGGKYDKSIIGESVPSDTSPEGSATQQTNMKALQPNQLREPSTKQKDSAYFSGVGLPEDSNLQSSKDGLPEDSNLQSSKDGLPEDSNLQSSKDGLPEDSNLQSSKDGLPEDSNLQSSKYC